MAIESFIPSIWAARLLVNLQNSLVYAQPGVINRDFEGDIAQAGDTVRINAIGPVTVNNYTKNSDIGSPETLTDAQTVLTISQSKYFNFQIDDVDRAQSRPDVMDSAMREAAYALSDATDQYVAGLYTDVAADNKLGSDASPVTGFIATPATAYNKLVDLGVELDEANVPRIGRWVVVPPWYHGVLLKDDRFVGYGTAQNAQALANGEVGMAAGFRILVSNNVPNTNGTKFKIVAGYPGAITFADQISKVEAYRPEKRFADAVKGLHLYGAKVVRPAGLALMTANNA